MRRSLQMGQLALLYTVGVSGGDTEHSLRPAEAPVGRLTERVVGRPLPGLRRHRGLAFESQTLWRPLDADSAGEQASCVVKNGVVNADSCGSGWQKDDSTDALRLAMGGKVILMSPPPPPGLG
jgi:hypothetical protein